MDEGVAPADSRNTQLFETFEEKKQLFETFEKQQQWFETGEINNAMAFKTSLFKQLELFHHLRARTEC